MIAASRKRRRHQQRGWIAGEAEPPDEHRHGDDGQPLRHRHAEIREGFAGDELRGDKSDA